MNLEAWIPAAITTAAVLIQAGMYAESHKELRKTVTDTVLTVAEHSKAIAETKDHGDWLKLHDVQLADHSIQLAESKGFREGLKVGQTHGK